jgi:hypothetical protein
MFGNKSMQGMPIIKWIGCVRYDVEGLKSIPICDLSLRGGI